jgi:hypothetical protein
MERANSTHNAPTSIASALHRAGADKAYSYSSLVENDGIVVHGLRTDNGRRRWNADDLRCAVELLSSNWPEAV